MQSHSRRQQHRQRRQLLAGLHICTRCAVKDYLLLCVSCSQLERHLDTACSHPISVMLYCMQHCSMQALVLVKHACMAVLHMYDVHTTKYARDGLPHGPRVRQVQIRHCAHTRTFCGLQLACEGVPKSPGSSAMRPARHAAGPASRSAPRAHTRMRRRSKYATCCTQRVNTCHVVLRAALPQACMLSRPAQWPDFMIGAGVSIAFGFPQINLSWQ